MTILLGIALYLLVGACVWLVFEITQRRNPYGPAGASLVCALAWPLLFYGLAVRWLRYVRRR